ncbi:MAG: hypothetical protein CBC09_07035 [Cellvibrionales bacterium TMED49]|nr:MAG: hypothetical protein CBC09_07035 [Cellvibrionales bacterium TMED49]
MDDALSGKCVNHRIANLRTTGAANHGSVVLANNLNNRPIAIDLIGGAALLITPSQRDKCH